MTKEAKFISAIALQVVIVLAIIIFKLSVLSSGNDVLLRIAPVDPRDPLRGDYVTFQYDISSIASRYKSSQRIKNGDSVFVILRQSGKYWTTQNVQKNKPAKGEICIKGKVQSGGSESQMNPFPDQRFINSRLNIVYGIEQYYIPEGKGRNFTFQNKEVAARVAVDEDCNALLKQIYVDNKPWP